MNRRRWTLLVMSDSETSVRQYRFSREVVQLGIAIILIAVSTFSSVTTTFVMKRRQPAEAERLAHKNDLLKEEIAAIGKQVTSLNAHLDDLAKQDEQFRLVAGLEPMSEDVQRVGIGGPGGERTNLELRKLDRSAADAASATADHIGEMLRRARLLSFSWRQAKDTLEIKHERLRATPSIVPTEGYLTSAFSRSRWHPVLDRPRPHQGVDITARTGTPIVAAARGTVIAVGYEGDYGLMVEIDHGFGVATRYAHASKALVRKGQVVSRGDRIALVGQTGLAVGPHLHYEVLINGKPTNPRNYFLNVEAIAD